MPLSQFVDFHKLTNNSGGFPDALVPAAQFALKWLYQIDLTDLLMNSTGDLLVVSIALTAEVKDAGGNLLLTVAFAATYLAGQDIFGFTEYVTRQSVTLTPDVTVLGDSSGNIIPGDGGAGAESGADIIFDEFESPVIVFPVPAGATVKITFHTAQYPALDDIEGLRVATRPGGGFCTGFRHGSDGQVHLAYSGSSGVPTAAAIDRTRTLQPPVTQDWKPSGKVTLLRSAHGTRQSAFYSEAGSTTWQVSDDGGLNYDMATIFAGYAPLGAVQRDGGYKLLLSDSGGNPFIGTLDRTGKDYPPSPITVPAGVKLAEGVLLGQDGGGLDFFYSGAAGVTHLHSDDELIWS